MTRPSVVKREGRWCWECRSTCAHGGKGFLSREAAHGALLVHLRQHANFGFRPAPPPRRWYVCVNARDLA